MSIHYLIWFDKLKIPELSFLAQTIYFYFSLICLLSVIHSYSYVVTGMKKCYLSPSFYFTSRCMPLKIIIPYEYQLYLHIYHFYLSIFINRSKKKIMKIFLQFFFFTRVRYTFRILFFFAYLTYSFYFQSPVFCREQNAAFGNQNYWVTLHK